MSLQHMNIAVYLDTFGETAIIGKLYAEQMRGKLADSFCYDDGWFADPLSQVVLDPDLPPTLGRLYPYKGRELFGMFEDCSPDRWGRTLMQRREAQKARTENRPARKLSVIDYLIGVEDVTRVGALRFKHDDAESFVGHSENLPIPPWTKLRDLEYAAYSLDAGDDKDESRMLALLLAPGSSLGGARPKATVADMDGTLWIAKFPARHDEVDSGGWEMVAHDLASQCGIVVPDAKLLRFSNNGHTFLVKRFDRTNGGAERIHFASAMTMLGKTDGDTAGYLDIVSAIRAYSAAPLEDLKQLWLRLLFNIAIRNTDDHLRNHGFILTPAGWRLSPAYDINPGLYGDHLALDIAEGDSTVDFDLALSTAEYYGIGKTEAVSDVAMVKEIVNGNVGKVAKTYNISAAEVRRLSL